MKKQTLQNAITLLVVAVSMLLSGGNIGNAFAIPSSLPILFTTSVRIL